ncbi:MAG: hypothetical protein IKQ54_01850 [Oscillospiraceae bacterium]|nr:hypothetical protein [Oscillospiraceae bacterium]
MNIYAAATLFAILILLYWAISEVFTVLFRLIGLPEEKAKFQVISLLTGAGFTTHESEMFLSTRSRRRLARITMLFGYVFNVTIVSAFVNVFVSVKMADLGSFVISMLIPLVAVAAVLALMKYQRVRKRLDRYIEKIANRYGNNSGTNSIMVIDQFGDQTAARVTLYTVPDCMRDRFLAQMDLKPVWNILVLMVEHEDDRIETPTAKTRFRDGDRVTVFGDYRTICQVLQARERFTDD